MRIKVLILSFSATDSNLTEHQILRWHNGGYRGFPMKQSRILGKAMLCTAAALTVQILTANPAWAQDERCTGYGALQSISLSDWESGLGSWTADTYGVANPSTFDTPDWAAVNNLPDGRAGRAAFAPNLDLGDCAVDDETGVLTLESPGITIPSAAVIPRLSFDHWFQTEFGWDGGNIKISINGGPFTLLPASEFELTPYTDTLFAATDEFGVEWNTNPLADQPAYTGTLGNWVQALVNLSSLAQAGDTIVLRFEFGVDACGGEVGWYVDDVEVYSCEAELPPSDCGNSVIDPGEQCDDGNDFIGDGCSNTCQIENGWQCADPTPAGIIDDPSFEAGTPNPSWSEDANNTLGSPICEAELCGRGGGTGPSDGSFWAWFGGILSAYEGSLSQSIVIPSTVSELTFDLEIPACDSSSDYLEVLIDGNREVFFTGASNLCGIDGYSSQSVNVSAYADGALHELEFHAETFSNNGSVSNFFIDRVEMPGSPSICIEVGGARLTLANTVTNDSGGEGIASEWTLTATGPTEFSGAGPIVSSGGGFEAGSYDLSVGGGPAGYSASDWSCAGGSQIDRDTVRIAAGENVTCTVTLDDTPPSLTLVNQVINDDGGTAVPADWTLNAVGPDSFSGSGPSVSSGEDFIAGSYDLSLTGGPNGYLAGAWMCDGGAQMDMDTVLLDPGDAVTCTVINLDIDPDFEINFGHAGSWFYPLTSGQGQFIDITPASQFMFIGWFTFTDASSENPGEQSWYTAQGNYSGNVAVLDLHETLGGRFDDPKEVETTKVGEVTLTFADCEVASMAYRFDSDGRQGTVPMVRTIPGSENFCDSRLGQSTEAVDINDGMDGAWYNPPTSGQGYYFDVYTNAEGLKFIFVSWFTYGDDTASGLRWLTAQGQFEGSIAEIDVNETTGGLFDNEKDVSTVRVGTMKIDFTDCETAILSYMLDDDGLEGDIDIRRVVPGGQALCEELDSGE
jgi:cysteine-rich repeat protein